MVNKYEQVVYEAPRISLNKLGEYLTTPKASRRERILRDAKFPPTFQVIRYDPTRELIQRFLCGKIAGTAALAEAIDEYKLTKTKDDFEARMKKSNLEAMERFKALAPSLDFGDAKPTMGAHAPNRWPINGVSISVRPEVHLTVSGGNVMTRRGAIKLNISKGAVHSKEAAEYVGALMRHYLADGLADPDECDHMLCQTLDVFGGKLLSSPKATVNRMKDIESACSEIARQWAGITLDS